MILMMMGFVMNLKVPGCQDEDACNYNENATDSDDSCDYAEEYYDCDGVCLYGYRWRWQIVMNMRCYTCEDEDARSMENATDSELM